MDKATETARLACRAFVEHDEGDLDAAARHFGQMYQNAFVRADGPAAAAAGKAFARALAIKDEIDADQDRVRRLVDPRWDGVYRAFMDVASTLNIDQRWAYHYNECWRLHKAELDYWTPCIEAERYLTKNLAPSWQDKRSDGRNGPGPLPFLYMAAVEAHDLHTDAAWNLAEQIMTLYFDVILAEHRM